MLRSVNIELIILYIQQLLSTHVSVLAPDSIYAIVARYVLSPVCLSVCPSASFWTNDMKGG